MDNFIFIAEVGGESSEDSCTSSRNLVRAHVMRKHWQDVRESKQTKSRVKRPQKCQDTFSSTDTDPSSDTSDGSCLQRGPKGGRAKNFSAMTMASRRRPFPPTDQIWRSFGDLLDPFVYAGSHIDAGSYQLFQHYGAEFKVILCNKVQPLHIKGPALSCTEAIQKQSPALLHAICYQAAGHEAVLRAGFPLRQNMFKDLSVCCSAEKEALYHKAAALANLGSLVSGAACDSACMETLILCVAILLAAEAIMGDILSLKSHTQGLRHLVEASGGILALPSAIVSQVQFADVKAAISRRGASSFILQPHLSQNVRGCARLTASVTYGSFSIVNFGLGFVRPSLLTRLCSPLIQCISYAKRLTLALSTTSKVRGTRFVKNYDIDDFVALDHSLLSLRDQHSLMALEECVRLAMLLYSNTALWRIPLYFNWITILTTDLKAALMLLDWHSTIEERPELVLWISLLGSYAMRAGSIAKQRWWLDKVSEVATRAGLRSWEDARYIMHTFAYVEEVYGPVWEEIWNSAVLQTPSEDGICLERSWEPSVKDEDHPCDYHNS